MHYKYASFSDIMIPLGVIIQQNVEDSYVFNRNCAKARKFLLLKWMLTGFLLSNAYRSVLLATLVSHTYEKPLDTIQDLLDTERPIHVSFKSFLSMMRYSPLESLRQLGRKIESTANATEIRMRNKNHISFSMYQVLL